MSWPWAKVSIRRAVAKEALLIGPETHRIRPPSGLARSPATVARRAPSQRPATSTGEADRPIFPTCLETEDEIILGTDDRHLDFRIGLIRAEGRLYMSTWVHPHNRWGRAYLALVMPFHILISRGAVARMATDTPAQRLQNG